MKYVESITRTNKLWCSDCRQKIPKKTLIIFCLEDGRMEDCYCVKCSENYTGHVDDNGDHIFSGDGLGQY